MAGTSKRKKVDWRIKAVIPNVVSWLPRSVGDPVYRWIQSRFGQLETVKVDPYVGTALGMHRYLGEVGESFDGKRVFEIGTGHNVMLPFMMWLLGAERIVTVDLNPYLKKERVRAGVEKMRGKAEHIVEQFSDVAPEARVRDRLQTLLGATDPLQTAPIEYHAPYDASATDFEASAFDLHVSNQVLEHVPPPSIRAIMAEARRIVAADGHLIHFVGLHDHFATLDPSISRIHFLKYSERMWDVIAGNRFMYHNRLRVNELLDILNESGFVSVVENRIVDDESLREVKSGFPLAERFRGMDPEDLAVRQLHLVAQRREAVDETP